MTITEMVCTSCGHTTNQGSPSPFCSQCGAEEPWEERAAYTFDEDDLPFVFSHEVYQDHSELWRSFTGEYFGDSVLTGDQIAGIPEDFPPMKYCVFDAWFRVTSEYEVEGPFSSKEEARA